MPLSSNDDDDDESEKAGGRRGKGGITIRVDDALKQPNVLLLPTFSTPREAFIELLEKNKQAWLGEQKREDGGEEVEPSDYQVEWHCDIPRPLIYRMHRDGCKLLQWTPHPMASAAHLAFSEHFGVTLTPDVIWAAIVQAFATHLKKFPNKYDSILLPHRDPTSCKTRIAIRRDDFIRSSSTNPWGEAIDEFSEAIKEKIGEGVHKMVEPTFSTTTSNERLTCQIVMMDILSPYFDYDMTTMCGIPFFKIEGTQEDWQSIHDRVVAFGEYDLEWWVKQLQFVLSQFISAFQNPLVDPGDTRMKFWKSFYKLQDMSGGPYVTGWINVFFPYVTSTQGDGRYFCAASEEDEEEAEGSWSTTSTSQPTTDSTQRPRTNEDIHAENDSQVQEEDGLSRYVVNKKARDWQDDTEGGPTTGSYPSGLSKIPFTWFYYQQPIEMEIFGGFVGISQDPTSLALRPEIGFGILQKSDADKTEQ